MGTGSQGGSGAQSGGPPRTRKPREHLAPLLVFDTERLKVSAPPFENSPDSCETSGPGAALPSGNGEQGLSARKNWQEAANLLAAAAKLIRSGKESMKSRRDSRAGLLSELEQLDLTIRQAGADGWQPLKDVLAEVSAGLRAWPPNHAAPFVAREAGLPEPGSEAAAPPAPEGSEGESEGMVPQDRLDRLTRELFHSLIRLRAPNASAPQANPETGNTLQGALPPASASQGAHDVLTREPDSVHRQLAAQFEAGLSALAKETEALRSAIHGAAKEIESASAFARNEQAAGALEANFAKFAQRLDAAESDSLFLPAIERAISALAGRLEETHKLVSDGATLAMSDKAAAQHFQEGVQSVIRELASLREINEETARTATLALTSIKDLLEQVSGCCARIETAAKEGYLDQSGTRGSHSDPFEPIFTRLTRQNNGGSLTLPGRAGGHSPAWTGAGPGGGNQVPQAKPGSEVRVQDGAASPAGFLIEPGLGFPSWNEAGSAAGQESPAVPARDRGEGEGRSGFIAAARRAARAAQMEQRGKAAFATRGEAKGGEHGTLFFARSRDFFFSHKLTIVFAAGILLAVLGTLVLAKPLVHAGFNGLLPAVLFHSSGSDAGRSDLGGAPAQESAKKAATSLPLPPANPPGQQAIPVQAAATARPASGAFDLLAPYQAISPAAGGPGSVKPRAIAGSDLIVAGSIEPLKSAIGPAPRGHQLYAGQYDPPATMADQSISAASGTAAGIEAPAPPNAGPQSSLTARAETGDAAAQFELAARYAEGRAGDASLGLAVQWYEKAARLGHAVAAYRLASLYERGHGVAKSIERAKELYQRAAEKGNIRAMHNLGVLAAEGNDGKPNYTSAALWFGKAAEFGIQDSQYNLAVLLARGLGVTKDLVKSYTWFAIAAAAGDGGAARKRDEVAAKLTSAEIAAANAAAAAFAPLAADQMANEPAPPKAMEAAPAQPAPVKPKVSGL
ncbi:MAG: hypothetical protein L0Y57_00510 [Beijerinckiaceae bacterium]|nr:hypothetical protein [Beijerinckiaceae bacterium]